MNHPTMTNYVISISKCISRKETIKEVLWRRLICKKKEYPCAAILKRGKNLSPTSSEIYFDYIWVAHVMFRNARAMGGVPTVWVFILFFGLSSGPISTCTKGGMGKSAAECKSIPSSLRSQVSFPGSNQCGLTCYRNWPHPTSYY